MQPRIPCRPRVLGRTRLLATLVLIAAGTAACTTTGSSPGPAAAARPAVDPDTARRYAAIETERFRVPAVSLEDLKPQYVRQLVDNPTRQPPGTIVIDPRNRFLYLVQEGGKALRYGVGVGREGLAFTGSATIDRRAQWPRWAPTPDMIRREPARYARWARGMAGGENNPLGARALYLYRNGRDTLFRIHGTNEPWTIGDAVSSGCIRMMNHDVIDLYDRISAGARVVVL